MKKTSIVIISLLFLSVIHPPVFAQTALTDDQTISEVMNIDSVTNADDLRQELQDLVTSYVNDPKEYSGVGVNFDKSIPTIINFRGTKISTFSMLLPLLPGSISDTITLKGKLAAKLKSEVTTYLLNKAYWDWENTNTTNDKTYLQPENPDISLFWNPFTKSGPHWEAMYALWAYAYYTGDWATIQNNWSFIKARYTDGEKSVTGMQKSVIISDPGGPRYRRAFNDLANGLIAYTRMAERLKDTTAPTARSQAKTALQKVLTELDSSWSNQSVYTGWDATLGTLHGEWSPGDDLIPETGRWINIKAKTTAQTRLDEAVNDPVLTGHWWTSMMNNISSGGYNEDVWAMPNLSHELFLGRAWMLQESGTALKDELPWHVVMGSTPEYTDALYYRSLYALISRFATTSWVLASDTKYPSTVSDISSTTPSPTPNIYGNGDVNTDGVVTTTDIKTVLQNWLAALTTTVDQYQDGRINTLDAVRVIKMLP